MRSLFEDGGGVLWVLAKIGAGQTGWWGPAAVFRYPLLERLAATRQPLTLVRANDDLWEATARARAARPRPLPSLRWCRCRRCPGPCGRQRPAVPGRLFEKRDRL